MKSTIVCEENVQRYYGENPELLEKYREITTSGSCPFCSGNIENEHIAETAFWNIVVNRYPYENARVHLLVLPKRHIISPADMTIQEWVDMANVIGIAIAEYPFLGEGYGLALRTGEAGGVTLYHLHWHLIAPKIGEAGQIPVKFGIG